MNKTQHANKDNVINHTGCESLFLKFLVYSSILNSLENPIHICKNFVHFFNNLHMIQLFAYS